LHHVKIFRKFKDEAPDCLNDNREGCLRSKDKRVFRVFKSYYVYPLVNFDFSNSKNFHVFIVPERATVLKPKFFFQVF
jgi:hypothetical protein